MRIRVPFMVAGSSSRPRSRRPCGPRDDMGEALALARDDNTLLSSLGRVSGRQDLVPFTVAGSSSRPRSRRPCGPRDDMGEALALARDDKEGRGPRDHCRCGATTPFALIMVLILGILTCVAVEESRIRSWQVRTDSLSLVASNLVAARDSTRDVALENSRVAKIAGESLRIVEKRVVQLSQGRDALDEALRREKVASYGLSLRVESVYVDRRAPTVGRSAAFHLRDAPYTIDADVALPPPPDSAALRLRIALDTLPVRLRVTCDGRTDAAVVVEAPPWAHVALGALSQDPAVCASRRGQSSRRFSWRIRPVVGAGRVLTGAGSGWGAFVGLGLTPGFDE